MGLRIRSKPPKGAALPHLCCQGVPQEDWTSTGSGRCRRDAPEGMGGPLGNLLTQDNPLMDSRTQDNPLMHFRIQDNRVQRFGLGSGRPPGGSVRDQPSHTFPHSGQPSAEIRPGRSQVPPNFPKMPRLRNPRENMHQEAHKVDFGAPAA